MARILLCAIAMVLVSPVVLAADPPQATYEEVLAQVKKSDPKADFLRLRMAFAETKQYDPYGKDTAVRQRMHKAFGDRDYAAAATAAEEVLKASFVDVDAQKIAAKAYQELGKADQAGFHAYVYNGLLDSILKSGDGASKATAYVVIDVDEEYAVLERRNIRSQQQGLLIEKDAYYDQIDGLDRSKREKTVVYFNISRPFGSLKKKVGK